MIIIIHGNFMNTHAEYICHQVNCQGVMESGVGKQIKKQWPYVYERYKQLCDENQPDKLLGFAQCASYVGEDRFVYNLFSQLRSDDDEKEYTDVNALKKCCQYVAEQAAPGDSIAMPYRIGCNPGNGDWGKILDMLTEVFENRCLLLYKMS